MAEPYFERLSLIVGRLQLNQIRGVILATKHFFSGAALCVNEKICASLSPAGLALKLPVGMRQGLIEEGKGSELRFFASIDYALGRPGSEAAVAPPEVVTRP